MKIVVDAMCAEYGGIRTYVDHLLGRWSAVHPEDELHVVVPAGSSHDTAGHVRHELRVRKPSTVGRPMAQTGAMHRLIRRLEPDVVLATVPSTTVRRPAAPLVVVILDLRHELRPEQFTRGRRLLRHVSYGRTYALADGFLSISQRSLDDLHALHADTRDKPAAVTHLGADHVLRWPEPSRRGPSVAFAHHTNKNPDLILDAWALLAGRDEPVPPLMMLGVTGARRERLGGIIAERSLTEHVTLAPFLPDDEFQRVLASADTIVFPSDFEGFGLPVVEGMALGKPIVIGPETATMEVADGHAVVMNDWSAASLADAMVRAIGLPDDTLELARAWGASFTWDRTVGQTREMLRAVATARS
ncbi:glycosyltransferase family 4 protein [Aeromicrobium sp.]|uniref:glycosyltransferase family 4 protein n=1 Tax=Aeromicrobium sp. TaxID=1871063 RepID=UPI002FC9C0F3